MSALHASSLQRRFKLPSHYNLDLKQIDRAELAKTKAKFTLTEKDGSLLVTHATELHFADGQVIVEGGHDISNVYRVKSGKITIIKNGRPCCQLTQVLFVYNFLKCVSVCVFNVL